MSSVSFDLLHFKVFFLVSRPQFCLSVIFCCCSVSFSDTYRFLLQLLSDSCSCNAPHISWQKKLTAEKLKESVQLCNQSINCKIQSADCCTVSGSSIILLIHLCKYLTIRLNFSRKQTFESTCRL